MERYSFYNLYYLLSHIPLPLPISNMSRNIASRTRSRLASATAASTNPTATPVPIATCDINNTDEDVLAEYAPTLEREHGYIIIPDNWGCVCEFNAYNALIQMSFEKKKNATMVQFGRQQYKECKYCMKTPGAPVTYTTPAVQMDD